MKNDPTVERIRQARHEISAECGHDPGRLIAYYMQYQKKYQERLNSSHQNLQLSNVGANYVQTQVHPAR